MGSLIMACADAHQVPAGGALAVDREGFAAAVDGGDLAADPLIEIAREEVAGLPPAEWDSVIVATGPLTSPALASAIAGLTGEAELAFFDAIAPIVHRDSIDMAKAWFQSRYDKAGPGGTGADYINCPLDRDQYEAFVDALLAGEKTEFKEWEGTPYFDGCLPIEVMAERGRETLRHGPMKPVGLTNPHEPDREALRRRAAAPGQCAGHALQHGRLPDEAETCRAGARVPHHPGLEHAEFARLGGLHRNTFLNSPRLLDAALRLKADAAPALRRPDHRLRRLCRERRDRPDRRPPGGGRAARASRCRLPPATTAIGALLNHITGGHIETIDAGPRSFQPMNVNFGLFPPLGRAADGRRRQAAARPREGGRQQARHDASARRLRSRRPWLQRGRVAALQSDPS